MQKSVSIRMGTTGKADVTRDFTEMGDSGVASANRWSKAYQRAGEDVEAALQRQANAAAKIAAIVPQSSVQMRIEDANGTGFGQWEGSARQSAAAFKELIAAEEQLDARTRALVSAIDPAFAAQQRYNAEMREATELHNAGRITLDQFIAAEQQAAAVLDRVAGITRTVTAETAELTTMQARVEAAAGTGFGQWEGSAKRSALAMGELLDAEEKLDARTRALVSAIDPAFAAQQRFNSEIAEAKALLDAGRISTEQYAAAEAKATVERDAASAANIRMEQSAGAVRAGYQQLSFQIGDVVSSLASGANPATVFAQQASQFVGALALITGGGEGGGAADASSAIGDLNDTLGSANDTFDATTGAAERLTTVMQGGSAATGTNTAATEGNAAAHGAQAASTTVASGATAENTVVTGANTAATEANAVATSGLAAAKGRLVAFMAGPWGAVLLGGITVLALMTSKYFENAEGAKEAAAAAGADGAAKTGEAAAAKTLEGAIAALNEITGVHNRSQAFAIDLAIQNADAMLRQAEGTRAATAARLADMKALQAANVQRASGPGQNSEMVAIGLPAGDRAIESVEETLSKLDANIIRGQNAVRFARAESSRQHAIATAEELDRNSRLRISTGAVADAERNLAKVREEGRAQLAAKKITPEQYAARSDEAERRLIKAQEDSRHSSNRRTESLARQASAMEVNAEASLELARAYLIGGDAALRAEAARKGLTDATRRGIDTDAQVQRQLQVMVGEQVANGAKSVAQLREETEARAAVRAQVLAGTLPVEGMAQALSDEAALRPLLKLQTVAQGEALEQLTKVIEAYRKALADAHAEEAKNVAAVETKASKGRFAETIESIRDLGKDPLTAALDAARRAAEREADAKKFTGEDRKGFVDARVNEARASEDLRRAQFYMNTTDDQRDSLEMAKLDLSLAAAGNDERDRAMSKLEFILRMKREGVTADSEEGRKLLENQEHLDDVAAKAKLAAAGFREMRDFGNDFVDTVLSEDTWSSWGNAGKTILNMLKSEFVKLALLNPLKNLINGDKALPTLSGMLGKLGSLFGGKPGNNAAGTEWWSGGATYLAENGPELVSLPQGSRVTPAGETRRLLAANDAGGRGGGLTVIVNAQDAVLAETVRGWVAEGVGLAAAQGAAGGAAMAEANGMAAGARTLGRWKR
ncbi:hypothetical protein CA235_01490 [Sphingomonas sp. ABOLF]|uniref:hypothetical protein n=1 Tax=Sphingomonas sp. ABOLF TaxID=1985879 RepID=UPI000F7D9777|nr:hypothetical protein [Sphingomonas sp. ABOLF]RSV18093.1 hypothetical protein CA235_01490 [Sphingomonas sp. ABOLF]